MKRLSGMGAGLGLVLALSALAVDDPKEGKDPTIGRSYRVPYRVTETNHWLVRARINGKGPFNFLVDSGAPALYIGTAAAKASGLTPAENDYWTTVAKFELEGGAVLEGMKARVEDPFQLVGMNALGLPGAAIDGILGFTVLARFKLEFDPTQDRMTWTRIDYQPKEPFLPRSARTKKGPNAPAELQMMQAMGPMMKLMAAFVGKQPEEKLQPQGYLGVAIVPADGGGLQVATVLADSPAAAAGLKPGDRLLKLQGRDVPDFAAAHAAIADLQPGRSVTLSIRRDGKTRELTLTAGEGF